MIKLYKESDQRTLPFQLPKLSIKQRKFIWTLAKTRLNSVITKSWRRYNVQYNEALTVFTSCLHCYLVKARGVISYAINWLSVICSMLITATFHVMGIDHYDQYFSRFLNLDSCNSKNVIKVLDSSTCNTSYFICKHVSQSQQWAFTLKSHSRPAP